MPQSPDNLRANHEVGMRLLKQNAQSFADGLAKSGLLSPGVVIDIRESESLYSHSAGFNYDIRERMLVTQAGNKRLTPIGGEIFGELMQKMHTTVTNQELVKNIWGYTNVDKPGELTKGYVSQIRQVFFKLGIDSNSFLKNIHGIGYMIIDEENLPVKNMVDIVKKESIEIAKFKHPYFSFLPYDYKLIIEENELSVSRLHRDILNALCSNVNRIVSYDQLVDLMGPSGSASGLRTHISRLRAAIKQDRKIDEPIISPTYFPGRKPGAVVNSSIFW